MKVKSGLTESFIDRYVQLAKRYGPTKAQSMLKLEKKDIIPVPRIKEKK